MKLFDLHTDTATHLFYRATPFISPTLSASASDIDGFEAMTRVFAIFTAEHLSNEAAYHAFFAIREHLLKELAQYAPKITPLLAVEDARILGGRLSRVDLLHQAGVSIITPLWRGVSIIGGAYDTDKGLSPFGRAAIMRMLRLGIHVDLSHASDAAFYEIAGLCTERDRPLLATHSASRAVRDHPRNLTDRQFAAITASRGLVGLTLCPDHLAEHTATSTDLLRHLDHFLSLGGEDTVALGTDFDGIQSTPTDLLATRDLVSLTERMAKIGYSATLIEKLFYKNAEAFFGKHTIKILKRQEEP